METDTVDIYRHLNDFVVINTVLWYKSSEYLLNKSIKGGKMTEIELATKATEKKKFPDRDTVDLFRNHLENVERFRPIEDHEKFSDMKRLGVKFERKIKGNEFGLTYQANGWKLYIWTSFIYSKNESRDIDAIWIIILEGDKKIYVAKLYRTPTWHSRTLLHAIAAKARVEFRPLCPDCSRYMNIRTNTHNAHFFACFNCGGHGNKKAKFLSWDEPLKKLKPLVKEKVEKYLSEIRKRRDKHKKNMLAKGKIPGTRRFKKSTYTITKPENAL